MTYITGDSQEARYRSEFEEWQDTRDSAREVTGGILIESTTDDPQAVVAANMLQPQIERDQIVTVSHPVRPREYGGATEGENFTVEHYGGLFDGEELRKDKAAFDKRMTEFRKKTPDFDVVTQNAEELPLLESVRRVMLKAENGPQIYHFLCASPEVALLLAEMEPLAAAAAVRQMSRDLANGPTLPHDAAYDEYRRHMNERRARRRGGRNG